jgi:alkanesulfonate monooxygenase SsuD/methylene tetrahydromethanopterin reductase-like flavin-dependent oxidoreductase (luciferase family)
VQVGFLAELRNPSAWGRSWPRHYGATLELVEEADRLGGAAVFLGEHHLALDGYIPQPLTFAAAIAARTRTIRIGTSIVIAPFRHPRHVAEQAAVVDILSEGRLELGLGAGHAPAEFEAFGVDHGNRFRLLDRSIVEVRRLLGEGVSPPPVQDRVPIWCGYFDKGAGRAGLMGEGLLVIRREALPMYLDGLRAGGHDPATARMAGPMNLVVASDPHRTRARIQAHIDYQAGEHARFLGFHVLTPQDAVTLIRETTSGLPVRYVLPWLWVAGVDDDVAQEHVRLSVTEVAPNLRPPRDP